MNFRHRRKRELELSMTPMIDVVFLLLIFFMVTTSFNRETELKISLPEANGSEVTDKKSLRLIIDAKGLFYVNQKQLVNQKLSTLKAALRQAAGDTRNQPFVIHADGKSPHQSVISALDVAGDLGFKHITFAAQQPTGK